MNLTKNVGIIGASGYGGNELVRLVLRHPNLKLVYVAADSSAGKRLSTMLPWIRTKDDLTIEKWDPATREGLLKLDLVFISLPTGASKAAVAKIDPDTKVIDLGGDHRFVEGWKYGLADIWPDDIAFASRVANPGCYPTAALTALAPLMRRKSCASREAVIIDAKSGISGAGRGGGNDTSFGFAEVNEDVSAYKLAGHAHVSEMQLALGVLSGRVSVPVVFTPHLTSMTRGILATCYIRCTDSTSVCLAVAREFYKNSPFVRVTDQPPHTKWATGSNLAFVSYGANENAGIVTALGAIDNLGKGAASQAVQNANLMLDLEYMAGLESPPLMP